MNADYLVDLLNVLPDAAEAYCNGPYSPLYARSERGDALLLPIQTEAKKTEHAEAERARKRAAAKAAVLGDMLRAYRESVERDPEYALTPDAFANMVKYAQPAA